MASNPNIIRFEPNGPADQPLVQIFDTTPDEVEAGTPIEMGHLYYESEDKSLVAGVWHCTAHTTKFGPYPVDEFMLVLEGSVNIVHQGGHEEIFRAGDAFIIPKGLPCSRKQTESMRKYYVIFEDPNNGMPDQPVAERAIRLSPTGPEGIGLKQLDLQKSTNFEGDTPTQHDYSYFEDATDRLFGGTWTCSPMRRKQQRFGRFEMMCLLEGGMTLTDDAGMEHKFQAPDVLLVLPDAVNSWTSTQDVRKFYFIFEE